MRWGVEAFGLPIHDNWWQTETGGIMIANLAAMDIRPGLDGEAAARRRGRDPPSRRSRPTSCDVDGKVEEIHDPLAEGELALRPGWPSMFRGYLHEPERYRALLRRRVVPVR